MVKKIGANLVAAFEAEKKRLAKEKRKAEKLTKRQEKERKRVEHEEARRIRVLEARKE